jgi:hypothetical protein
VTRARTVFFASGTVGVAVPDGAFEVYGAHGDLAIFVDHTGRVIDAWIARQDRAHVWAERVGATDLGCIQTALAIPSTGTPPGGDWGWLSRTSDEWTALQTALTGCTPRVARKTVFSLQQPAQSLWCAA